MVFLFSLQFPAGGLKLKIIVVWKPGNFSPKNNTFFDWSEIWFTVINSLISALMQDCQFFPTLYVFFVICYHWFFLLYDIWNVKFVFELYVICYYVRIILCFFCWFFSLHNISWYARRVRVRYYYIVLYHSLLEDLLPTHNNMCKFFSHPTQKAFQVQ